MEFQLCYFNKAFRRDNFVMVVPEDKVIEFVKEFISKTAHEFNDGDDWFLQVEPIRSK